MPATSNTAVRLLLGAFLLSGISLLWPTVILGQETTPERAQVEAQLQNLKTEIQALLNRIDTERQLYSQEQAELKSAELAVQAQSRELARLQEQQTAGRKDIERLQQEETNILARISTEQGALGEQVAQAYRLQRQSRLKLMLNQDDPEQISRLLAYFDFYNRARADQIADLRLALAPLLETRRAIAEAVARLDSLIVQAQQAQQLMEARRQEQAAAAEALADSIGSSEQRVAELERNRVDLEALLERISQVLADIPADLGSGERLVNQKGQLPWPLTGPVRYGFGQDRNGSPSRGWLISGEPGADIASVGHGRVAFADWLRGFGLLIIVDHGDDLLSLYGHADTLMHEVGDWVNQGDRLATAGRSGGSDKAGLYFEMRRAGAPIDPASWLGPRNRSQ